MMWKAMPLTVMAARGLYAKQWLMGWSPIDCLAYILDTFVYVVMVVAEDLSIKAASPPATTKLKSLWTQCYIIILCSIPIALRY